MIFIFVLAGIVIGQTLNFFIHRIPREEKLYKNLPTCRNCDRKKRWYEYIFILGYFKNRICPKCKLLKSSREIILPIVNAICYLIVFLVFDEMYFVICCCLLSSTLIVMSVIDYDFYIIPDRIHIIVLLLAVACCIFEVNGFGNALNIEVLERLLGFFAISVPLLVLGYIIGKVKNTEAIGGGDVKIVACLGFFAGIKLAFLGLIFGSVLSLIILPILRKRNENGAIAFGPFLALGIFIAMLCGNPLIDWYFGIFGI